MLEIIMFIGVCIAVIFLVIGNFIVATLIEQLHSDVRKLTARVNRLRERLDSV